METRLTHRAVYRCPSPVHSQPLRGALIDGVDFYLVDLRHARYDAAQAEHFRRCKAILDD